MSEHVEDLVEEFALGLLSDEQARRVEVHTATCAGCRRELDAAMRTAALLAAFAAPVEPPPAARKRLLARVAGARRPEPGRLKRAGNLGLRLGAILWPAAAGLSLTLALAMVAWNVALQLQLQQLRRANQDLAERLNRQERRIALVSSAQVAVVDMAGTEDAPGSEGRAYMDRATGTVWVTVSGLPALDEAWTYQLWLIGPAGPESAGFLAQTSDGRFEVWLSNVPGLNHYQAVGVSLEQAGGSAEPTRVMVVGGT